MTHEEKIERLEQLIEDYWEETHKLTSMRYMWEIEDDHSGDPGLQFEQEQVIDSAFSKIVEFSKNM